MIFAAGYSGNKVVYMAARDLEGGNSGWQALGTWNAPGSHPVGPVGRRNDPRQFREPGANLVSATLDALCGLKPTHFM